MQNRLFRRIALERLSSPEQLDQLMQITTPRAWIALTGFGILILGIVIWSFTGRIPVTVQGEGILIRGGGINNVSAPVAGRISDVYVDVGGQIENGQVLARILDSTTNENVPVYSSYTGRILEIRVSQEDFVNLGDPLMIVEATGNDVKDLEGIIYLPATEGKKIQPGMRVQISPTIVRPEEYGVMLGWVTSVGEFPESQQSMSRVLENNELVQRFSQNGAPIEVRVDLIPDGGTVSGYKWSSSVGPNIQIRSGTLASATIIVDEQIPIRMVFPGFGSS